MPCRACLLLMVRMISLHWALTNAKSVSYDYDVRA